MQTAIENYGVLDDLDVRASDLLQANGVIWVEGPSDRLYLTKWLDLWSGSELTEGEHYQCVSYGGRLLAHLDASTTDEEGSGIKLLRVNRNCAVVIDSDKGRPSDQINSSKKRIVAELASHGGLVWITDGREIENYWPVEVIRRMYAETTIPRSISKWQKPEHYLDRIKSREGARFLRNKVLYAERIRPLFDRPTLEKTRDLAERLDSLCNRIREWNNLPVE